jgi:DNA-binding NtrC family response regulator
MQVVLLRFLESGEIQRVGSERAHARVNVRLITATNRDLRAQIVKGDFREDLYFRLNVVHIEVPPLRERLDDVPVLMQYYLDQYARSHKLALPQLGADALATLMAHRWPGNVRELKNVAERVVLRHPGKLVSMADLPSDVLRKPATQSVAAHVVPIRTVAEELTERMMQRGESFWSAVYPQFMSRDITRLDLRAVVQIGLEATNGNYRLLVRLFNMPQEDYKRFLSLLRKHDCHLPFQKFRAVPARLSANLPALAKEA